MPTVLCFEDLEAWKTSRELVKEVYRLTRQTQFSRDFALVSQIRRAAISVPSNIAEGFERGGDREFVQFLAKAKGSCGEVRAQLHIACDQGYVKPDEFRAVSEQALRCSRLISGLMTYLRKSTLRGSKYKAGEQAAP